MNLFDLNNKVALVTGASRGIGESIARTLAAYGAHVIVTSRKQGDCEIVAQSIRESGGSAEALACHIGDMGQIDQLFAHLRERDLTLDILVNNAATNPHFGSILDIDVAAFEKTVQVNIRGYFFMSQNAAKIMREKGEGCIINVASVNGVIPGHFQGVYSITKAAVINMTKAFAKECAEMGIRVNAILPGATDTKFASTLVNNPKILKEALKHIPMKRVAQPDEMSGTVLYLASQASSYTTGACLQVDGGYLVV